MNHTMKYCDFLAEFTTLQGCQNERSEVQACEYYHRAAGHSAAIFKNYFCPRLFDQKCSINHRRSSLPGEGVLIPE